ncbi:MerR family transcriptional regulator [Homoserinimonas sp. A520]
MKISELCESAGITQSTLKYYVREGLVPEGRRTSSNQTEYKDTHLQRAKLARALIDVGALSIADARQVLGVLDTHQGSLAHVFDAAQHAMGAGRSISAQPASEESRQSVTDLVAGRSWAVSAHNPGNELVARALDGLATIGFAPSPDYLEAYAEAASIIARADLAALAERSSPALVAELMVVGTVMGDALMAGLRRLAQEHETAAIFPAPTAEGTTTDDEGERS